METILDYMNIKYRYEERINIDGKTYILDFPLRSQGKTDYLEHLGMLRDISYNKDWDEKRANYESVGISEILGNLIITNYLIHHRILLLNDCMVGDSLMIYERISNREVRFSLLNVF
ncbi:hypothetical protein [Salipaludibacillus keqinensis]|nr:hypothetical protein [Salipaludibacillus keqinensis]